MPPSESDTPAMSSHFIRFERTTQINIMGWTLHNYCQCTMYWVTQYLLLACIHTLRVIQRILNNFFTDKIFSQTRQKLLKQIIREEQGSNPCTALHCTGSKTERPNLLFLFRKGTFTNYMIIKMQKGSI